MKKLFFTLTLMISLVFIGNAQTEQGIWLVSASTNLSFTSTSFDGPLESQDELDLTFGAGNFVSDNLALGLNIGYNRISQGNASQSTTLVGPFIRYYVEGSVFFGASYLIANSRLESGFGSDSASGNFLGFEAGYPIWVIDSIAIEPSVSYAIAGGDFDGSTAFGVNIGFGLYF